MTEILQEITNTPRCDVRINRESGILYGVKIIGCFSRNGREYPNETLRESIPLYENSKVNLDHPEGDPGKPRSYQDRFGVIRNVTLRENEGLFADFRFNPKHAVAEQLLWDAEHAPDNVGFSHNVEAVVRREQEKTIVEKIIAVRSVDLVADPATTAGLFESAEKPAVEINSNEKAKPNGLALLCEAILNELRDTVPEWKRIIDEPFVETITMLSDETLIRRLIDSRIRLLEEFRKTSIIESKPVSREQSVTEKQMDTQTFVKLIQQ
jgi:hypothetical protein